MINLLLNGRYDVFILLIIALTLSLSFHEFGHAIVAKWQGDDTAERAGRLTLNPLAHIDPTGVAHGGPDGGLRVCQTGADRSA